ncbi:AraC family transcriptional regulator [Paraburkholderia silvatlantica]|uniref:AraC-like DNA-binding protein n=1 Tax=Paraburkholderia silvatlantica TaxID=321895 RepID=A0ABR6FMK3_9BURK|nr:AraC family transcriptional regulator [Paraburkholderia silvatlantica]MBB2928657.1 AraC-like DNA-binding protein [Paraburkholderia silvatlantica]PVY35243.1 AraC-like DNA-binding protein [Paraburkholderia silvatlantica]PXW40885.1 AraC-like DNA-binding protein [Paraburkholderia silvatlantica]TDQ98289.1 AraC-like DNA-binding protein [Paraburkholderia silvatlantica]
MPATNHAVRFHATLVRDVDAMTAATARSFGCHTHDQYGIGVIDRGGHVSLSDAGQVEAVPGDLILVNPGEVHDGRPLDAAGRTWRMLYFEPRWVDALQADITQGDDAAFALHAPVISEPRLRARFDAAFTHVTDPGHDLSLMAFEAAALELMTRLVAALGHRRALPQCSPAALARVRDMIDTDPAQPLSLAELAQAAGLSRFQLHRGFLRAFGVAPHGYILHRRVALARRLLKAGHAPAQTALAAGFCDQSHLNRAFARQFGVSPGRYRLARAA